MIFEEYCLQYIHMHVKIDFIEADIHTMKELLQVVQEKINSNDYQNYDIDKIQLLQLRYLCSNLKTFITQMS